MLMMALFCFCLKNIEAREPLDCMSVDVVLVLDASASAGGFVTKATTYMQELIDSLDNVGIVNPRVAVIAFGGNYSLVSGFNYNLSEARNALQKEHLKGFPSVNKSYTNVFLALDGARDLFTTKGRGNCVKIIVLCTDGHQNMAYRGLETVDKLQEVLAPVYAVELNDEGLTLCYCTMTKHPEESMYASDPDNSPAPVNNNKLKYDKLMRSICHIWDGYIGGGVGQNMIFFVKSYGCGRR